MLLELQTTMCSLEITLWVHLLKAQQKMPHGHRRTTNIVRQVPQIGESRARLRNEIERRNQREALQANEASALLWMSAEQRLVIFTILALDSGAELRVLLPFDSFGASTETNPGSEANSSMDFLASLLQATTLMYRRNASTSNGPPLLTLGDSNQGNDFRSSDSSASITDDSNQANASQSSDSSAVISDTSNQGNVLVSSDCSALIINDSNPTTSVEQVSDEAVKGKNKKNKKKNKKKKNNSASSSAGPSDCADSTAGAHGPDSAGKSTSSGKLLESSKVAVSGTQLVASEKEASVPEALKSEVVSTSAGKEVAEINQSNDISSESFSDAQSTFLGDYISDEWISYESTQASDDIEEQSSVKEDHSTFPSEKSEFNNNGFLLDTTGNKISSSNVSNDGTSNELHSSLSDDVAKEGGKLSESSDDVQISSSGETTSSYIGKENSKSGRQKDQKENAGEQNSFTVAESVGLKAASKEVLSPKRVSNVLVMDKSVKSNDGSIPEAKVSEHSKSKQTGKKQEFYYYSRKGSNTRKANLPRTPKAKVEEKEPREASTQLNDNPLKAVPESQSCDEKTLESVSTTISDNIFEETDEMVSSLNESDLEMPVKKNDKKQLDLTSDSSSPPIEVTESVGWESAAPPPSHGSQTQNVHELVSTGKSSKDTRKSPLNSHCPAYIPLTHEVMPTLISHSTNLNSASPGEGVRGAKSSLDNICTMKEQTGKSSSFSEMDINLNMITDAASEAHRLDMVSRTMAQETGSCLAEFEKLANLVSPVLDVSYQDFQPCSNDYIIGSSTYRNTMPDSSLKILWNWYDKIGSYGLGVNVENLLNSSTRGVDCFTAYFMPTLSAIQLFGDVERTSRHSSGATAAEEVVSPRSRRMLQKEGSVLLFEYFAPDIPYHRPPVHKMMQDLTRGSQFDQVYGNPKLLNYINLRNLHPGSWFSVAWYPIYKVPGGGAVQGCFLTYHSLSHFVQRQISSAVSGVRAYVSCPVVGLLTFRAEHEYWLKLKPSLVPNDEETSKRRAKILQERIHSLEKTATLMSTASVLKGISKQRSYNCQRDYGWFICNGR